MKQRTSQHLLRFASIAVALISFPLSGHCAGAEKPSWLGPAALVASHDGNRLFVALADAQQIAEVDASQGRIIAKVEVPSKPSAIILDERSGKLYVSCAGSPGTVCVLDSQTMKVLQSIPAAHSPAGLAIAPDGSRLFVCNRFDNDVSVFSLPEGKELARVKAVREPIEVAITPDGKTVLVINLLPSDPANRDASAAQVTAIDAASLTTVDLRLPVGSSSVRGICISPDGKRAFVTHVLSRNALPTTQVERGWMNTNALSILDAQEKKLIGTILLDDVDRGAANPWSVACSGDGAALCITHSGTHELSVLNLPGLFDEFARRTATLRTTTELHTPAPPVFTPNISPSWDNTVVSMPLELISDLSFLGGLRHRISLPGNGPRGLVVANGKAYAAMYFSDTIAVVDLNGSSKAASPVTISLGPIPQLTESRRGEMLFHDATRCFQHWQSCATCHPDARADALNWDLMNDGFGNPKNTKSMLLAHRTPPAMSQGVRENAEMAVRAGFKSIQFMQSPETDAQAVDSYLKTLEPVPSSHLVGGELSPAAKRGKELFNSKRVGCAECHPAPLFTDLKPHQVGTRGPSDSGEAFDTPTLIEAWRTAPYLHDGRCKTMADLIGKDKHGISRAENGSLSEQEIADLAEYVLSL
jgi:DNA-binding beta-propeller fold protein YncE